MYCKSCYDVLESSSFEGAVSVHLHCTFAGLVGVKRWLDRHKPALRLLWPKETLRVHMSHADKCLPESILAVA
jgi:hypothetical protein